MKKSIKAALLSALVFPGCGHLLLKKYATAALLAGISMVCVYFMLTASYQLAEGVVAQIQSGQIPLDANQIVDAVNRAEHSDNRAWWSDLTSYLLGICWLFGTVDSYRLGLRQEQGDQLR